MKKLSSLFFLFLAVFILIPVLSGCKGGSAPSSKSQPASSSVSKPSAVNELAPGLWKMTVRSTINIPSVMGRPPINHSAVTTMTECIKPNAQNSKPYAAKPANFKCSNVKEHVDMEGAIHWVMKCRGPKTVMLTKGVSKITQDSFKSHGVTVETSSAPGGISMKATVDTTGKRVSGKCPSKS
ncbi:MAG: DUF3617 family protein [Deltaproteobacteria bacterium]|nr:DUF3617 family protein [Deltaproteobacteria bacterium]